MIVILATAWCGYPYAPANAHDREKIACVTLGVMMKVQ